MAKIKMKEHNDNIILHKAFKEFIHLYKTQLLDSLCYLETLSAILP